MPQSLRHRIAIVGAGASGALMTAHLLRCGVKESQIALVERSADIGRGLAYATQNPSHLLNVRAANMSAFADDHGHFARWLASQPDAPRVDGDPEFRFVSRGAYGRYLESLVRERLGEGSLTLLRDEALAARVTPDGVEIALASGAPLQADLAILACGHESVVDDDPLFVSPWAEPVGGGAPLDATLLILGTGLTMVDTALALDQRGHRGRIVAVSRRGLTPHGHRNVTPLAIDTDTAPFGGDLATLLHWLRRLVRDQAAAGGDWRSVVDGLRPHTQAIWRSMSLKRQGRFLQHARPWWDIHRHRMAPEVAARFAAMVEEGRLEIVAGRLLEARPAGDGAEVVLRRRGGRAEETLSVARIISCKGVTSSPERNANPVVRSLFAAGLARTDPLGIGIEVAPDCAIVDCDGRPSERLFAIGPMSQAAFWEITAVPDIRLQTAALAARLSQREASVQSPREARSASVRSSIRPPQ